MLCKPERLGPKTCMVLGFVVMGVGFAMVPGAPGTIAPAGYPREAAWVATVFACSCLGLGVAFETIPTLPAMKASLPARLFAPDTADAAEDMLSSLFSSALSLGETIGPLLGGLCVAVLPETHTAGCEGDDCESSFPWASMVFGACLLGCGLVMLLLVPDVRRAPPPPGVDDNADAVASINYWRSGSGSSLHSFVYGSQAARSRGNSMQRDGDEEDADLRRSLLSDSAPP
mmetsp:Transcript_22957/g.71365  ORF Transcript_22957/g.71365 Transcript_22957/m.71365 type:complete len:230 (+) Transcript_22957:319-1008(+)